MTNGVSRRRKKTGSGFADPVHKGVLYCVTAIFYAGDMKMHR